MVPIVYHPEYRRYYFGPQHPFSPIRQEMLLDLLAALGHAPQIIEPAPATRAEILTVHSEEFVAHVEQASQGEISEPARFGIGTMDVPVFESMDLATRYLAGGTLHAARLVASGEHPRLLQLGGGLHHAQHALASGFCIYNDLSLAIRHFTAAGMRVAYIDIDVHHGDGVQWLHYADGSVLTISLHEAGQYLYPGTGHEYELGEDAGRGYKLNVPLEPGTGDDSYLEAFDRVVPHAVSWFRPDVLLVACGADAHYRDPLADLLLTTHAYETLFRHLLDLAEEYTGGRVLFTTAGGYDMDATVRVWALLYLVMNGQPIPEVVPLDWKNRWEVRLGASLSTAFHDAPVCFPASQQEAVEQQNRFVSKRLMEMAAVCWY